MNDITLKLVSAPLYRQVEEHLTRQIHDGVYPPGSQLPTDQELREQYGVSRITVRHALDNMARNNLVTRQQGVGTFVNSPDRSVKTTSLFGYIDDIHPHINLKLLKVEQRTPPASIATTMRLAEGEHCTCYVSVNQAGREPLSYIEDFFPADSARYLNENDFLGRVPPTRVLEMRSGRIFAYAEQTMGAVASPPHIAKALGLPVGHPIMRMERVYFAVGDIVLHATEAHYHPERYQYSVRVIPRANTTPRQVQLP